ncbi:MAG: iron ABC transporter substrate-binding protein [Balneolia bacterium]|nr:iron ABC transporter substrate-binding protein [Balneolia bacterium]
MVPHKSILFSGILLFLFVFTEVAAAQLTVYSGRNRALVEPLVNRFEAETGINVRIRYGGTTQLAVAIMEEGRRSPADIFWSQDAGALGALHANSSLMKLPENLADNLPPQFTNPDYTWIATSGRARVLAYDVNRTDVTALPESIFDLTKPEWRGKVGWAPSNASFQSFVTAMRATEGDERTREWLRQMKANGAVAYNNNNSILQAIEAGEVLVGLTNHYYIDRAKSANPNYVISSHSFEAGDVGNLINVAGLGILSSSNRQAEALKFIEFMLQDFAQQFFMNEVFEYPVKIDLGESDRMLEGMLEITPDINLDALRDLDETLRMLRQTDLL